MKLFSVIYLSVLASVILNGAQSDRSWYANAGGVSKVDTQSTAHQTSLSDEQWYANAGGLTKVNKQSTGYQVPQSDKEWYQNSKNDKLNRDIIVSNTSKPKKIDKNIQTDSTYALANKKVQPQVKSSNSVKSVKASPNNYASSTITKRDKRWYFGASYGKSKHETGVSNLTGSASLDDKDKGYKIYSGYKVNKYVAAEVFFADFGEAKLSGNAGDTFKLRGSSSAFYSFTQSGTVKNDALTVGVAGVFSYPLHKYFEPHVKLGIHKWAYKSMISKSVDSTITDKSDGVDLMYGLGFDFPLNQEFSLRTEYEIYKFGEDDIDFLSAGVIYKF